MHVAKYPVLEANCIIKSLWFKFHVVYSIYQRIIKKCSSETYIYIIKTQVTIAII